jgi:hypothetical protein
MKTNITHSMIRTLALVLAVALSSGLRADTFGTGGNTFTIDFVTVGNAGNTDDTGDGGGSYSSPFGGVSYTYRIGTYEVSQDAITKATNAGMTNVVAGAWGSSQPATSMTWYEAAAFVNWLNTSTGHQAAYNLTYSGSWSMNLWTSVDAWQLGGENLYRHKSAFYFLPSEDEWYKAAYHKNDGATANYWDYATASNTAPTAAASGTAAGTAVYGVIVAPASVNDAGGFSPYGTRGQNGNVWEWVETAYDGANTSVTEDRVVRGGSYSNSELYLRSSYRPTFFSPTNEFAGYGLRVASIPEPSAAALLLAGIGASLLRRRRRP